MSFQTTRKVGAVGWYLGRDGLEEEPKVLLEVWSAHRAFFDTAAAWMLENLKTEGAPKGECR
jgi:hypothetical protein